MAKARNDLLDRAAYVVMRAVAALLYSLPVEWNIRIARRLGDVLFLLDRKHRERAQENLGHAYPDWPAARVRAVARESLRQFCVLGVEVLFTTRLVRIDTWSRYVDLAGIEQTLALLLRKNQGLVVLTGHYGSWEILGYVLATLGFEINVVARPIDNPYVDRWLLGVREKQGQKVIAKKGATEEVTQVLDRHGVVGFIADQDAGRKGVFVDFFGRKASTYKSIALVAMQYEVPVVVGYARRDRDRFHFRAGVRDVIHPADWKDRPDPLRYITQRYTSALESIVREDPAQYLWAHRRWKSRPKGEGG